MDSPEHAMLEQIPRLRRYARALTGDIHQADDLVQDCLARAWSRLRLWCPGTNLRSWLFTIMHNLYANECRRRSNMPMTTALEEIGELPHAATAPDKTLELRELQAALAALPAAQREVLLLVSLEGMRYEQVADVLSIPVGTVMSRLHRARERVRTWLEDDGAARARLRRVK